MTRTANRIFGHGAAVTGAIEAGAGIILRPADPERTADGIPISSGKVPAASSCQTDDRGRRGTERDCFPPRDTGLCVRNILACAQAYSTEELREAVEDL